MASSARASASHSPLTAFADLIAVGTPSTANQISIDSACCPWSAHAEALRSSPEPEIDYGPSCSSSCFGLAERIGYLSSQDDWATTSSSASCTLFTAYNKFILTNDSNFYQRTS